MAMTIIVDQDVIEEALITHITGEGINTSNKNIGITITSGRQGNGCKAEVTLTTKPAEPEVAELLPVVTKPDKVIEPEPVENIKEPDVVPDGSLFANAP